MNNLWYVYLIQNPSGLLYTGISTNPPHRLKQHNAGQGAKFTKGKGPWTTVWTTGPMDHRKALATERKVKKLRKTAKLYYPAPDPIRRLLRVLNQTYPQAVWLLDSPEDPTSTWFLDVLHGPVALILQYQHQAGFGIAWPDECNLTHQVDEGFGLDQEDLWRTTVVDLLRL